MTSRSRSFAAALAVALLAAACGGGGGGDGGGGSSPPPPPPPPPTAPPPPPPPPASFSGVLKAAQDISVDFDVNDPDAVFVQNNSAASAQLIPVGSAIGATRLLTGFVTESPTGVSGDRFAASSDPSDFFRITAKKDEVILLDFRDDALSPDDYDATTGLDIDLYVYDSTGDELLAASSSCCTPYELVLVEEDGEFVVEVSAFRGRAGYVLSASPELAVPAILPEASQALMISGELSVEAEPTSDIGRAFVAQHAENGAAVAGSLVGVHLTGINARARAADVERATNVRSASLRTRARTLRPQSVERAARQVENLALVDLVKALNAYEGQDTFKIMHAYRVDQAFPPSDPPDSKLQWNLGQIYWSGSEVQNRLATSPRPLIAVLDGGFRTGHPELSGIVDERDFMPAFDADGDGTNDEDGYDADAEDVVDPARPDDDGRPCHVFHGTHVASIAAAPRGNGGMVGVYPGADIMAIRLGRSLPPTCGMLLGFSEALLYAAGLPNASGVTPARAADVINLSFGSPYTSAVEREAVEDAIAAGAIIVAAAGNDGDRGVRGEFPHYPGAFDGVIAVGATSSINSQRTNYSSYYPQVDILAPGGFTVDTAGDGFPDFILGASATLSGGSFVDGFALYAGTSMATAHASAGFALMKAIAPDLTSSDLERLLRAGQLSGMSGAAGVNAGLMELPNMVTAAINFDATGAAPPTPAGVVTSPYRVDLGRSLSSGSVWIRKTGEGPLSVTSISPVANTMRNGFQTLVVRAEDVDANGFGRYAIVVNREPLGLSGGMGGSIEIKLSNGTSWFFPASYMTGGASQVSAAPVTLQVQLRQGSSFVTVHETTVSGSLSAGAAFSIPALASGDYRILAGTDMDNDGKLCDSGELCAKYPSAFGPSETTALTNPVNQLELTLNYRLPSAAAP